MNQDEFTTGDTSAAIDQQTTTIDQQAPRLRIHHLLLWMLCSAVYLTFAQTWIASSEMAEDVRRAQAIMSVYYGLINGIALTACIVLFRSNGPIIRYPGHWFLIATTSYSFLWFLYWMFRVLGIEASDLGYYLQTVECILLLFPIACYIAAIRYSDLLRWKIYLIALLLVTSLKQAANLVLLFDAFDFLVFSRMDRISTLGEFILLLWLLVLSMIDIRRRVRWDWLHWLGICTAAASLAKQTVWTISLLVT